MDNSYKRLGVNSVFVFLGKAGSGLISILMLPFYTHWLSPGEYGTVDLITTYSTILLSVGSACIADAIFVVPKNSKKEECISFFSSGILFLLIASILLLFIAFVTGYIHAEESFILSNRWNIVLLSLSMVWLNFMQQFVRTIDKMTVFASAGIVQTLLIAFFSLILIPQYNLQGYINALIFANVLVSVFVIILSKEYAYLRLISINRSSLVRLLQYSIPLIPNSIVWWLVNGLNRPIIESHLGLGALGLYAVAIRFPNLIISLCDVFMNAFSISIIEEYGKSNFQVFFNNIFRLVVLVVVFGAIILSIFSPQLISIFADKEFYNAWYILPVLTISTVFSCSSTIVGGVFIARKQSKYFFYSSIWGALSSIIFTFLLVKIWGLTGCAVAACLSFMIMFVSRLIYAWRDISSFEIGKYINLIMPMILVATISILDIKFYIKVAAYMLSIVYLIGNNACILYSSGKYLLETIKKRNKR